MTFLWHRAIMTKGMGDFGNVWTSLPATVGQMELGFAKVVGTFMANDE
jgi:hypothetical protein